MKTLFITKSARLTNTNPKCNFTDCVATNNVFINLKYIIYKRALAVPKRQTEASSETTSSRCHNSQLPSGKFLLCKLCSNNK